MPMPMTDENCWSSDEIDEDTGQQHYWHCFKSNVVQQHQSSTVVADRWMQFECGDAICEYEQQSPLHHPFHLQCLCCWGSATSVTDERCCDGDDDLR